MEEIEKLSCEDQEKVLEGLNILFDSRIKSHVENSVDRHKDIIDKMIKDRISGPWPTELSREFLKRVDDFARCQADNHIRLSSLALKELVAQVFDKNVEKYIEGEVTRRLNSIKRKMMASIEPEQKS